MKAFSLPIFGFWSLIAPQFFSRFFFFLLINSIFDKLYDARKNGGNRVSFRDQRHRDFPISPLSKKQLLCMQS